ncbi:acyl-CoA dehydrogenase family protein [Ramlibacter sp.]|uniref:acyl-CoA dehydrogenase family protein n=1 Tax=Ramlibacter sp. TaxID=1917967 RepID=UPI003D0DE070
MPLDLSRSWSDADLDTWRDSVRRFVADEVEPGDAQAREDGHVGHALWRRAGELGMLCTDIPDTWGGMGGDFRHEAVFVEEMSRRALSGMNTSVHSIVAHYLLNHGTDEQKARYLPRMASGELVGAIAMSEPGTGSDLQSIRTQARRTADGRWRIDGAKTFISNGYLAGLVLVVCKTDPEQRAKGTSILLVETEGAKGYSVGKVLRKIGMKAQDTSELFFDGVEVHADSVLGGVEGKGFFQLMSDLPYERLLIAVLAAAGMEGAYEAALAYARERKVFGQPIAEMQNARFKLAEVATQIMVGRAFVDQCIEKYVAGNLDTATASMAKLWASETQGRVVDECLQLFGGYGYMEEYLIGRMYVDARVQRIYGGTSEIMKEVIARSL